MSLGIVRTVAGNNRVEVGSGSRSLIHSEVPVYVGLTVVIDVVVVTLKKTAVVVSNSVRVSVGRGADLMVLNSQIPADSI